MRFPFFRNRDSVKNGILISIRRTGDGFHPGLFTFIAGMIIDIWYIGIGCLMAWVIWFVMFILLLMDRHKREG